MEWFKAAMAGNVCDRAAVLEYHKSLPFDKQLELLAGLSERLKSGGRYNAPMKGACDTVAVTHFLMTLGSNERLALVLEMIQSLKNVPKNNNIPANYVEPTNEELEKELEKLNTLESKGGRRRKHKSRKASRRRLTRRRR